MTPQRQRLKVARIESAMTKISALMHPEVLPQTQGRICSLRIFFLGAFVGVLGECLSILSKISTPCRAICHKYRIYGYTLGGAHKF